MAGIADLMYGPQAYAVPQPQVSMADILAGGVPAATPSPGGSVSTAYADSAAPGAVAAAGAQANAAAAQEPGILERARNWATTNPVQAQALMQGFAALASGRTQGGLVRQLGQAAGVATQTMAEQTAANNELATTQANKQRQLGMEEANSRSQNASRDSANARENALQPGRLEAQDLGNEYRDLGNADLQQRTGQNAQMFTPKMEEQTLKLQSLRQQIKDASNETDLKRLQVQLKGEELKVFKQYGPAQAQALLDKSLADLGTAQEKSTQAVIATDAAAAEQRAISEMSPEDQRTLRLGLKPPMAKPQKTAQELATELYTNDPAFYTKKDGTPDYDKLNNAVGALQNGGARPAASQQAWEAARSKVKVGQRYTGPDGQEYVRRQ